MGDIVPSHIFQITWSDYPWLWERPGFIYCTDTKAPAREWNETPMSQGNETLLSQLQSCSAWTALKWTDQRLVLWMIMAARYGMFSCQALLQHSQESLLLMGIWFSVLTLLTVVVIPIMACFRKTQVKFWNLWSVPQEHLIALAWKLFSSFRKMHIVLKLCEKNHTLREQISFNSIPFCS